MVNLLVGDSPSVRRDTEVPYVAGREIDQRASAVVDDAHGTGGRRTAHIGDGASVGYGQLDLTVAVGIGDDTVRQQPRLSDNAAAAHVEPAHGQCAILHVE